jgi:hypothetical protein
MRIVLVVLSNFQNYVLHNILHMKQHGNDDIIVLSDRKFITFLPDYVKAYAMEDLLQNYDQMVSTYQNDFRNGFWHWTSFRFYAILAYMKKYNITQIVHVENDVMIFENIANMTFHRPDKILLTMDNQHRCVPGFMYIPNAHILEQCLFQFDHKQNDMQNLGNVYHIKDQPWIETLPIAPKDSAQKVSPILTNHYEHYKGIFDAASMGQYLGGIDPRNSEHKNTKGFINTHCEFQYHSYTFSWIYEGRNKVPYITIPTSTGNHQFIKIMNLHVHSKNLCQFIFSQYTPSMRNLSIEHPMSTDCHIVSGELLQSCCEMFIGAKQSDFSNPYIKYVWKICKIATLDDISIISKIKHARSIFIFTHLLQSHMKQIQIVLQGIEVPFVLVCHNSDENFTQEYGNALLDNCPNLIKIYTQNLMFSPTNKIRPLPIGLANRMWTHGNTQVWKTTTKVHKTHLLYYYCDVNTNTKVRHHMCQVLKEKGLRMQPRVSYDEYIQVLKSCKFAICPEGNGIDTHRFWECLYAKTIPICIRNPLVEYYSHFFPIILLNSWHDFDMKYLTTIYDYNDFTWHNPRLLTLDYYEKQIHCIHTKYFLSFASENRQGFDFDTSIKRITNQIYNTNEMDAIICIRPSHFDCNVHQPFWKTHQSFIKSNIKGYGLWVWKAYIVHYVFDTIMNLNDILLWSDVGCEIQMDDTNDFTRLWQNTYQTQIVGSFNRPEIEWTKRDLFVYLNMDNNKDAYDSAQRQTSTISFHKTPYTSKLVKEWYETSCHHELIDESPGIHTKRGPFQCHRHDQSIFSLLTKKYQLFSNTCIQTLSPIRIVRNKSSQTKLLLRNTWMYILIPTTELRVKQSQNQTYITDAGMTFAISHKHQSQHYEPYILNGDGYKYTNGKGLPNIIDGIHAPKYEPKTHKLFTVIRNPFEMLYLLYKTQFGSMGEHEQSIKYIKTFSEFIEKYCNSSWPYPGGFPCPYLKDSLYSQIYDQNQKCIVDIIFIYEELEKGLFFMKEQNPELDINQIINDTDSSTTEYKQHYTPHMIEMVNRKCTKELELFGYSFEGHHGRAILTKDFVNQALV